MPATCYPAPHGANPFLFTPYDAAATTAHEVLSRCRNREARNCKEILQSTFQDLGNNKLFGARHGFVDAAVQAYSEHFHLAIRPDDVWISILTQLSIYVNTHAEELRSTFVTHEGKKELTVTLWGNRHTVDFGRMAKEFCKLLEANIKDPSFVSWIMQDFSTTTDNDRVVNAIVMMATVKEYFSYRAKLMCGLPSVTLLGSREDWVQLKSALTRLSSFGTAVGSELEQWAKLLDVVVSHFICTFDAPDAPETKDFWQKMAHHEGGGSGPAWLSGWITAFCYWKNNGQSLREQGLSGQVPTLVIDGQEFHQVDTYYVPHGSVTVPVLIDDNGVEFDSIMVAGSVAINVLSSGKVLEGGTEADLDTLQPVVGWWIFEGMEGCQNPNDSESKNRATFRRPAY